MKTIERISKQTKQYFQRNFIRQQVVLEIIISIHSPFNKDGAIVLVVIVNEFNAKTTNQHVRHQRYDVCEYS